MQRRRSQVRTLVAFILLITQTACMTAPRAVAEPQTYLRQKPPSRAWITLSDGTRHEIQNPRVFGDSVLALRVVPNGEGEELWVSMTNIREMRVRRVSPLLTAALVAGVAAGVALLAAVLSGGGDFVEPCNQTNPEDCP